MSVGPNSSRENIRAYQRQLNKAGANPPLVLDGIWGPKTDAAHNSFGDVVASGDPADAPDSLVGTSDRDDPRFGIGGGGEIWQNAATGEYYLVYTVPGTDDDPIYMRWSVPDEATLQSFFGPGQTITVTRTLDGNDALWADAIDFGSSDDLANVSANPFDSWASTMETEAATKPWILDQDYQTLLAMSILEERPLTAAEIATTQWWQNHNPGERQWMEISSLDPARGQQIIMDGRNALQSRLQQMGMSRPPDELVNFLSDMNVKGTWTAQDLTTQIMRLTDSYYAGDALDPELQRFIDDSGVTWDMNQAEEGRVRRTVTKWLGTNFGQWDDDSVSHWAGILRNESDGIDRLEELLKDQRLALFPEYDREATWDSISSPWKNMIRNTMGTVPDDSDKMLHKIIRMNDAAEAGRYLTEEGLQRENATVEADVQRALDRAFGGV